jgi:hypothetical protein
MINLFFEVGSPWPDDLTNPVGGSVQYYDIGIFSVYINLPVYSAFQAEFRKTKGVQDTVMCIEANKRVTNAMP